MISKFWISFFLFSGIVILSHPVNSQTVLFQSPIQKLAPMGGDTIPLDFPFPQVTFSNDPAPGEIYLSDFTYTDRIHGSYLMKLDNSGNILFERRISPPGAYAS